MADPDARLAAGLAAIAEHGRRTGSLASAADIRQRGDRRRAHRRTLLVAAGTLGAVLAVAGQMTAAMTIGTQRDQVSPLPSPAVSGPAPRSGPPTTTGRSTGPTARASTAASGTAPTSPATSPTPSTGSGSGIPTDRPYQLLVTGGNEVSAAGGSGPLTVGVVGDRVQATPGQGAGAVWVLQPVGGRYLIMLSGQGTERVCMTAVADTPQSQPTIRDRACDPTSANQLFTIVREGTTATGAATYSLHIGTAFLQVANGNLVLTKAGAGSPALFVLADGGKRDGAATGQ